MEDIGGAKNFSRTPTSWDAEDDILLMHLKDQQKLGWKEIASHFVNRTPNACQFRWRRLKLGNLKNPPKSIANNTAGTASTGTSGSPKVTKAEGGGESPPKKKRQQQLVQLLESTPGRNGPFALSTGLTFTGYDNNVSSALAGLNALLNTPSNLSTPGGTYNPSTPHVTQATTPGGSGVGGYDSPESLDPPQPPQGVPTAGGGYYADISIDPTMNLPHNQPHPHAHHLNRRRSTIGSSNSSSTSSGSNHDGVNGSGGGHGGTHRSGSVGANSGVGVGGGHGGVSGGNGNSVGGISGPLQHHLHHNSIIQIVKDDRTSISSSTRASVSSLPSKSMNIPHHQLNNNALAHLPVLFGGGGGSISGPSPNPSISGPPGIASHLNPISSLRNGSVVGLGGSISGPAGGGRSGSTSGYYSRSGSVVIPYNGEKKVEEYKLEKPTASNSNNSTNSSSTTKYSTPKKGTKATKSNGTVFKIPWSMEEDELLINRRNRELSFAELSILLPQRTEGEIWSRIDHLEKLRNGHRASRDNRRQSLIGLDDVDDFYDVEDVMIDSDEEEDDDDVLLDVDDSLGGVRRKKRRASSAVNPLSMERRRLR